MMRVNRRINPGVNKVVPITASVLALSSGSVRIFAERTYPYLFPSFASTVKQPRKDFTTIPFIKHHKYIIFNKKKKAIDICGVDKLRLCIVAATTANSSFILINCGFAACRASPERNFFHSLISKNALRSKLPIERLYKGLKVLFRSPQGRLPVLFRPRRPLKENNSLPTEVQERNYKAWRRGKPKSVCYR